MNYNWTCQHCGRHTTLTEPHIDKSTYRLEVTGLENNDHMEIKYIAFSCPNPECKK